MTIKLPGARTADILEQDAGQELLIYDLRINKAYSLDETSAIIYKACNRQTFEELKREYNYTDELIYFALDELKKQNLLEGDYASPFAGMNRREVIRKVGLAPLIALPVISSLVAPTAANAASGPTACAQRGGTCIPAGQNVCANRANQTVSFYYYNPSAEGACRGSDAGISNPNFPCGNTSPTTGFDICRVG